MRIPTSILTSVIVGFISSSCNVPVSDEDDKQTKKKSPEQIADKDLSSSEQEECSSDFFWDPALGCREDVEPIDDCSYDLLLDQLSDSSSVELEKMKNEGFTLYACGRHRKTKLFVAVWYSDESENRVYVSKDYVGKVLDDESIKVPDDESTQDFSSVDVVGKWSTSCINNLKTEIEFASDTFKQTEYRYKISTADCSANDLETMQVYKGTYLQTDQMKSFAEPGDFKYKITSRTQTWFKSSDIQYNNSNNICGFNNWIIAEPKDIGSSSSANCKIGSLSYFISFGLEAGVLKFSRENLTTRFVTVPEALPKKAVSGQVSFQKVQ